MTIGCGKKALGPSIDPVTRIPGLRGMALETLMEEYDEPAQSAIFTMNRGLDRFRMRLLYYYPRSDPRNRFVRIKELWWKDGVYNITVWFHQVDGDWIVLDSCRWHENTIF